MDYWRHVSITILLFLSFGSISGQGRERNIQLADSVLNVRGEVYFSFSEYSSAPELARIISVDKVENSIVFAYANKKGFNRFLTYNIAFKLQPENFNSTRLKKASLSHPDSLYPSYPHYLEIMRGLHDKYSDICELHEAGVSVQGRKILMLKITSPSTDSYKRPSVLLTSTIHGNELTGYKLLLWLSEYLLENYGKDDFVTELVNKTQIWINPLANPDGTYFGGDSTVLYATRFNANSIDLNRNFPDPAEGEHPDGEEWQPEAMAMMNFHKQIRTVLSANLHTGEEVINYPWDTWSRLHADNNWYLFISRRYVDLAHQKNSGYMTKFNNGVVNGFLWYRITGGRQDYVNYYLNSREVTIELSDEGMPDSVSLAKYWEYNRESLLQFIQNSLFGIVGRVSNVQNQPLAARVEILNYDKDNSWVFSDSTSGVFYRFPEEGEYSIRVTVPGYNAVTLDNIVVSNSTRTELDIKMQKSDLIEVFPSPFNNYVNISGHKIGNNHTVEVSLFNAVGKVIYKKSLKNNVSNFLHLYLPDVPSGVYFIRIEVSGESQTFKILKQ